MNWVRDAISVAKIAAELLKPSQPAKTRKEVIAEFKRRLEEKRRRER